MSVSEQIFFHTDATDATDATVEHAARALADALDFHARTAGDDVRLSRDGFAGVDARVVGDVGVNFYAEPDIEPAKRTAFADYPLVWDLFVAGHDIPTQQHVARTVFDAIVHRLGWPALLVHDLSIVVADWRPERGLRQFPDGTLADSAGRPHWAE